VRRATHGRRHCQRRRARSQRGDAAHRGRLRARDRPTARTRRAVGQPGGPARGRQPRSRTAAEGPWCHDGRQRPPSRVRPRCRRRDRGGGPRPGRRGRRPGRAGASAADPAHPRRHARRRLVTGPERDGRRPRSAPGCAGRALVGPSNREQPSTARCPRRSRTGTRLHRHPGLDQLAASGHGVAAGEGGAR
jgi:hypothetical protein